MASITSIMRTTGNRWKGGIDAGRHTAVSSVLSAFDETNGVVASENPTFQNKKKSMTLDTLCPGLRNMEYAVRGQVAIAADKIHAELETVAGRAKYPFDRILFANIGNPHALGGVQPLTWPRQVMALVDLPDECGVDNAQAQQMFPPDSIARAKDMKQQLDGHGSGAYTHSKGVQAFRQDVANFITTRDGGVVPSNPDDIFLTNGASSGIEMILKALIANPNSGVMIPVPQYPIYSATITLLQGKCVGYRLDEENGWALNAKELERSYQEAVVRQGIDVRALVVINPGNPSGSVLTRQNLHEVVQFCSKHNLVLLADEVYQENVYSNSIEHQFISCKRAAYEMGLLGDSSNTMNSQPSLELVSFHSTSKGVIGECGRRGGYMELVGIDGAVKEELYKLVACASLCGTNGQIMTSLMVRGPKPGDASYESHEQEKQSNWESLKRRSEIVYQGLNAIPGFSCQPAMGAMYCFPKLDLPPKAIQAAHAQGVTPDTLYALSLLERTGICVVPSSGFELQDQSQQGVGDDSDIHPRKARYGFRMTFLLNDNEMTEAVQKIRLHYEAFCQEYS